MSSLETKKILSYALKIFLLLMLMSFIFEFVYSFIKNGSFDIAYSKWTGNSYIGKFLSWIVISILFGIYKVKLKGKKADPEKKNL